MQRKGEDVQFGHFVIGKLEGKYWIYGYFCDLDFYTVWDDGFKIKFWVLVLDVEQAVYAEDVP